MTTNKWYVLVGDEEMGPLGPKGLRKLADRGELGPDSMLRRQHDDEPVRASEVPGLLPQLSARTTDFTGLRGLGVTVATMLGAWCLIGVLGVWTALDQYEVALRMIAGEPTSRIAAGAPFLGIGGVLTAFLFFATGVLFVYWLWIARNNLPALIQARLNYAPSWTIAGWLMPVVNLIRPYQVVYEVDQLSAEADADGDAGVHANPWLLGTWWFGTLALGAIAVGYRFVPAGTGEQLAFASTLHIIAGGLLIAAAGTATVVVARVTWFQERAHRRHLAPVRLHHEFGKRRGKALVRHA